MHKLRPIEYLYLAAMAIFTYLWIQYDDLLLPELWQRMTAFVVLAFGQILLFFAAVKPPIPMRLSHTLAAILIPLFIAVSLLLHLVIIRDGFQWGSVRLWGITAGVIYLCGYLYQLFTRKK